MLSKQPVGECDADDADDDIVDCDDDNDVVDGLSRAVVDGVMNAATTS